MLLLSTDPAHSLADVLGTAVSDEPRSVDGAPRNLHVRELDAPAALAARRAGLEASLQAIADALGSVKVGAVVNQQSDRARRARTARDRRTARCPVRARGPRQLRHRRRRHGADRPCAAAARDAGGGARMGAGAAADAPQVSKAGAAGTAGRRAWSTLSRQIRTLQTLLADRKRDTVRRGHSRGGVAPSRNQPAPLQAAALAYRDAAPHRERPHLQRRAPVHAAKPRTAPSGVSWRGCARLCREPPLRYHRGAARRAASARDRLAGPVGTDLDRMKTTGTYVYCVVAAARRPAVTRTRGVAGTVRLIDHGSAGQQPEEVARRVRCPARSLRRVCDQREALGYRLGVARGRRARSRRRIVQQRRGGRADEAVHDLQRRRSRAGGLESAGRRRQRRAAAGARPDRVGRARHTRS